MRPGHFITTHSLACVFVSQMSEKTVPEKETPHQVEDNKRTPDNKVQASCYGFTPVLAVKFHKDDFPALYKNFEREKVDHGWSDRRRKSTKRFK